MCKEKTIIIFKRRVLFNTEAMILLSALIVYLICAVFNSGVLHPDEHFQILEFAKWKLGEGTPQAMAWEHVAKIRPTLQPVLAMEVIRLCRWIGLDNPFHQAMVIRIITAMVMLFSIHLFVKAAGHWVNPKYRNALLATTLFFWIVPMIGVHFSSEILSTVCLLLLLAGLLNKEQPSLSDALWMGIVAALGFEFRYQMAFAYIGILLWILVIGKYRWYVWCIVAMGFLGMLALCTALDFWFYGKLVFAPYNYYYMNIVMHVAAAFGVSPWYTYFLQLGVIPSLALGVPVLLSVCIGTFKHYKNPVVWAFWAFLLFHSAISHKELRFIFPLILLLPLFMVWTYEVVLCKQYRSVCKAVIALLAFVNIGGLIHAVFKPAASGKTDMMQYLCEKAFGQECLRVKTTGSSNPFRTGPLISQFYLWQPVDVEENYGENQDEDNKADIIVLKQGDTENRERILSNGYAEVYRSIPKWQDNLNRFYHIYDSNLVLIAYEKK